MFTTHVCCSAFHFSISALTFVQFLDEADLLADKIAVLAAPGKLVAEGSPVTLKSTLGQGYSVQVAFEPDHMPEKEWSGPPTDLVDRIREIAPHSYTTSTTPHQIVYHLKSKDSTVVEKVLQLLDDEKAHFRVSSYDVLGTSIEDIFLGLMHQEDDLGETEKQISQTSSSLVETRPEVLKLTDGRPMSPLSQALTIFRKRTLIARRSWLTPLLIVIIAVAGACVPLFFISNRPQTCIKTFRNSTSISLYLPSSPLSLFKFNVEASIVNSPPDVVRTLGQTTNLFRTTNVADNATFEQKIEQNYRNLSLGGVSLDLSSGLALVAWEASPPGINGPAMLNLATNIMYNRALNTSGRAPGNPVLINANYESFPVSLLSSFYCLPGHNWLFVQPIDAGTLVALKWVAFYGAAMVGVVESVFIKFSE